MHDFSDSWKAGAPLRFKNLRHCDTGSHQFPPLSVPLLGFLLPTISVLLTLFCFITGNPTQGLFDGNRRWMATKAMDLDSHTASGRPYAAASFWPAAQTPQIRHHLRGDTVDTEPEEAPGQSTLRCYHRVWGSDLTGVRGSGPAKLVSLPPSAGFSLAASLRITGGLTHPLGRILNLSTGMFWESRVRP